MPKPVDKQALLKALVAALVESRDRLAAAQRVSQEGVTHEDARSEGDKDMRATEASYVARGQAMRVEALEADLARAQALKVRAFAEDDPIALAALVTIGAEEGERVVFLAPAGGGVRLEASGTAVHVVTPSSPLGRALLGARVGDVVTYERAGKAEEVEIVALA
ncbi:MAG: GreA/GreB family elongation factor [Myxococcales bacterium]|nr:GreA/GreB family elongation factor [Myxococcales bacterium]